MDCMSIQVCRGKQKFCGLQVGKDYLDRAYKQCKNTSVQLDQNSEHLFIKR